MTDHQEPLAADERINTVNEQIRLIQRTNGLTYGTDAFLLSAFVRPQPHEKAVDLGSGTGIIPLLLLAKSKIRSAVALEIQKDFAALIRRNAALNGMSEQLKPLCADVRTVRPCDVGGEVALVVSNPPYMKVTAGKRNIHDEKFIARHEVCGEISDFCAAAARLLRHGGRFVAVWRPDRLTDLLNALHEAKLEPKRMTFVHADAESEPCAVLTESVKGGAPSLHVAPPLLLYEPTIRGNERRVLTPTAQKIYDTCQFPD